MVETMVNSSTNSSAYVACVPHVPFLAIHDRKLLADFWRIYEERAGELRAFDPELVVVFGGDHYDGLHLKLMPPFIVAQRAEAMDDVGGYPGHLNIPADIAFACTQYLIDREFDVATSYAMTVDHGFSNVLHNFLGRLDAKPVLPICINALCNPMPTLKRCRKLGEAIGRFASGLGKRVAFLGSGGLSHDTTMVFPQYDTAPDEKTRDFIVHGGEKGEITMDKWLGDVRHMMNTIAQPTATGEFVNGKVNREWDDRFLAAITSPDLSVFDNWQDADIEREAGNGAAEIRQWIAAVAAARACGAGVPTLDYVAHNTALGSAACVVHASSERKAA